MELGWKAHDTPRSQGHRWGQQEIHQEETMRRAQGCLDHHPQTTKEHDMELESYFDFLSPEEIRIKGTRIGIETVLEDYLKVASPEEIVARYRTLTLEQVYAALLHYSHNQAQMDAYLKAGRAGMDQAWQEWQQHPSLAIKRLRALKAQRAARRIECLPL
jgi:uncharacterized protein (DUF433 family)